MDIEKLINSVQASNNLEFKFFCFSDEAYEKAKEMFPESQLVRIPQVKDAFNDDDFNDKVYIIPVGRKRGIN